jgi:hypothetical protein
MKNPALINLDTVVVQTEGLLSSELDGDTVLMGVDQAAYYGLDSTGQRIWSLIDQPRQVSEVCDTLIAEYEVDRTTCEEKVYSFLNELSKEGLIRIVE